MISYILHILTQIPWIIFILPVNVPLDAKGKFEVDRIKIKFVFLCIPVDGFTLTNSWVFSRVKLLEFHGRVCQRCDQNGH